MTKLKGKVALVTGSGRGIGRAIALKLVSEGAKVVVNDLDAAPGDAVAAEIRAAGGEAIAINGSVSESGLLRPLCRRRHGNFRRPRHHRQQRRLHLGLDDPEDDRRAVPGHARRPSRGTVSAAARCRRTDPDHGEERSRGRPRSVPQGRQHLVDCRALRQCRASELFVGQGVAGRPDAHAVQGMGTLQGQRQLRGLRPDQYPPDPADRNPAENHRRRRA